ncbi:MAG: arginine--tRNA ligase [Candidatus Liptonbacteria bacterium]|nr:arginine--tRNA ligase [Candidatus Liptonbacteria bacterium]
MRKKLETILKRAIGGVVEISVPENEQFGHYSTNAAMRLSAEASAKAGLAKIKKAASHKRGEPRPTGRGNPMDLATELVAKIERSAPRNFFERIEIVVPGFINFWISKEILREELLLISKHKEKYGRSDIGKKKKIIIDYSSPNIAKPMHVGHLRSTIIGDALANIYEFAGFKVIRWNYIGDWGTQFGKLIAAYKRWGNKTQLEKSPIAELLSLYVRFHKEETENPIFAQEARDEFMKLESGNAENKKLWNWFRRESMKEFKKIYAVIGVKFDVALGEAFLEPYLKPLIKRLYKKKIAQESDGALIVPLENLPPALIQKSDESSLYLTRDIAGLEYRLKKYKPTKIIYVVSNEQTLHFSQFFAVAEKMGLKKTELAHVKFGMVLGEKGKKLSTRSGEAVRLEELLEKSVDLARKIIEKKNPKLKAKEKESIAIAVGLGAVKYNDLKENRLSDISFDWDKMLDFSGDSAPYLQYTYARLRSILRKTKKVSGIKNISFLDTDIEMALIRKMAEFPETVRRSAENLTTNNIAKYLYELANLANKFYETTPILSARGGSPSSVAGLLRRTGALGGIDSVRRRRNARLILIDSVTFVMNNGLGLLGIKALEKI